MIYRYYFAKLFVCSRNPGRHDTNVSPPIWTMEETIGRGSDQKKKKKLPLMSKNHFLYGMDTRVGIPILPHKEHPNFKIYNS